MTVYYNEWEPYPAQWLRNLITAGELSEGTVDETDIRKLDAESLRGYRQAHFFAGIGGWPLALRLAGWPDEWPVWTGSCPCQPFSVAGKGHGNADERHLWPAWFELIRACRPEFVFGEQVAATIGHGWLDGVFADLEGEGYTCGAAVLGAHSVNAPHIRQRLFWVAYAEGSRPPCRGEGSILPESCSGKRVGQSIRAGLARRSGEPSDDGPERTAVERAGGHVGGVAEPKCNTDNARGVTDKPDQGYGTPGERAHAEPRRRGNTGIDGLGNSTPNGRGQERAERGGCDQGSGTQGSQQRPWDDFDAIPCRDGKARRVEPGTFPLAHGIPARVGKLRAYGNAIVPALAAEFVRAFMETLASPSRSTENP